MKKYKILIFLVAALITAALFAGCTGGKTVEIIFNTNGGSAVESVIYSGDNFELPKDPVRENYFFVGWYTDNGTFTRPLSIRTILESKSQRLNVYAKWQTASVQTSTFTVSFESNGGSIVTPISNITSDSVITAPSSPFKSGYAFGGWYKDAGLRYPWNFRLDTVSANLTLYARWVFDNYEIKFETNGGSTVASIYTTYNSFATRPSTVPTREYYTFNGWYSDAGLTIPFDFASERITTHRIVYAGWKENINVVEFRSNGGTIIESVTHIADNARITAPPPPTKKGHTFTRWYKDSGLTTAWNFGTDNVGVNELTILYAGWDINTYRVTFNANGGTGTMNPLDIRFNDVKELTTVGFTRVGYSFAGWAWSANGEVVFANRAEFVMFEDGILELFAIWRPLTVNVTFSANGASGNDPAPIQIAYKNIMTLPDNPYIYSGYSFDGWMVGTKLCAEGESYTMELSQDVVIRAQWSPNTYYIYFNPNGGYATSGESIIEANVAMPPVSIKMNASVQLPSNVFLREGYHFTGWGLDSATVTYAVADTFLMNTASNKTLYAIWEANTYKLTLNAKNNAQPVPTVTYDIKFDEQFSLPLISQLSGFVNTGYYFTGWTYTFAGTSSTVTFVDGSTYVMGIVGDVVLYAQWAKMSYFINFDANSGDGFMDSISVLYQERKTLPVHQFSKRGYDFVGWNTRPDGTGANFIDMQVNVIMDIAGGFTLYAKWSAITVNISFSPKNLIGGADTFPAQNIRYDASITLPDTSDFTKTGYTFAGWSLQENAEAPLYTDKQTFIVKYISNVLLYPVWTPNKITIKFMANSPGGSGVVIGEMEDMSVDYKSITPLSRNNFECAGFEFWGWTSKTADIAPITGMSNITDIYNAMILKVEYNNMAMYTMSSTTTITLYALWANSISAVVYYGNGGMTTDTIPLSSYSQNAAAGSNITLTANRFIRTNHIFEGWSLTPNGDKQRNDQDNYTMPSTTVQLYAVWTPITNTIQFDKTALFATGLMLEQVGTLGTQIVLRRNVYQNLGYAFGGWATSESNAQAQVVAYTDGATITVTGIQGNLTQTPIVLYAIWVDGTKGLSYSVLGGVASVSIGTATNETYIKVPRTYKEGNNTYLVTSVADSGFKDAINLVTIDLSENITSLATFAFAGCTSLENVNNCDRITSLGVAAFMGCTLLKSVNLQNLRTIGENAFMDCTSLVSLGNPIFVSTIGSRAFKNCTSLSYLPTHAMIQLTDIRNNAFENTAFVRFTIPASCRTLGIEVFSNMVYLTELTIMALYDGQNQTTAGSDLLLNSINVTIYCDRASTRGYVANTGWVQYRDKFYYFSTISEVNIGIETTITAIGRNIGNFIVFVPSVTRPYSIQGTDPTVDSYCTLYDENFNVISAQGSGGLNTNFLITATLQANTLYYICVGFELTTTPPGPVKYIVL